MPNCKFVNRMAKWLKDVRSSHVSTHITYVFYCSLHRSLVIIIVRIILKTSIRHLMVVRSKANNLKFAFQR